MSTSERTDTTWFDLPAPGGFFVYALFGADDNEVPLYIGQSTSPIRRIASHLSLEHKRVQIKRISVMRCSSKQDMDNTERLLIAKYRPAWNTAHVGLSRFEYSGSGFRVRNDRLHAMCRKAGITTNAALASAVDVSPAALYRMLSGDVSISIQFVAGALRALDGSCFEDLFEIPECAPVQVPA